MEVKDSLDSKDRIRYDTRCYFNVRSKADISQNGNNWTDVTDLHYLGCVCNRTLRSPRLQLVPMTTSDCSSSSQVSGTSQCFIYSRRVIPSATLIDNDAGVEQTRKWTGLSVSDASNAERDYRQLYCPHRVKYVSMLLPRQEGHLVSLTDISECRDVAFTGITCFVVVAWRYDGDACSSSSVYRTCGQISLSAKDVVNPQFGLPFNASVNLSGL